MSPFKEGTVLMIINIDKKFYYSECHQAFLLVKDPSLGARPSRVGYSPHWCALRQARVSFVSLMIEVTAIVSVVRMRIRECLGNA
ncbi:hypothetical protein HYPBUDRAFT_151255 [Hyphopichia burtonii NRRL Y-1933]|uniref:Uncharacterized protein n=1 Tax=Hyphopichia burtonii NRRL Y-1933 TaxID=984485 RepID=A0A1E4RQG9_9ASCO|nr:hypothetical protein HYPBUDRAFT_151255 [Hyphopichia burtonii NRRL Y-1933]ODV69520.1 hypothetical protein HYPBUDRAFT_151255 [Hyphopichia burtonii NRRL Y-1933]